MSPEPLHAFLFAGLFSPGPNVILLTTSGARFGFGATVPHLLGVALGVGFVGAATALGVGALLLAAPALKTALQVAAAGWILWMAWTLARASRTPRTAAADRPWSFGRAVLFQWINPKLWAVAVAASAGFAAGLPPAQEALRLGTAFTTVNLGVCLFWTAAGAALAWLLTTPAAWRVFNGVMAAALAVSAGLVFL